MFCALVFVNFSPKILKLVSLCLLTVGTSLCPKKSGKFIHNGEKILKKLQQFHNVYHMKGFRFNGVKSQFLKGLVHKKHLFKIICYKLPFNATKNMRPSNYTTEILKLRVKIPMEISLFVN